MTTTPETERPRGWLAALDVARLWRLGPLYLLIAISPGVTLWSLVHPRAARYIVANDLPVGRRQQALVWVLVSIALTTAAYVAEWRRRRRSEPGLDVYTSIEATNRWAFIALAGPLLVALNVPAIEVKQPLFTGFLMVAVTALAMVFCYRLLGLPRFAPASEPFAPARRAAIARAVFAAAFLGYCGLLCHFTLLDHRNLATNVYDLGIYDNLLWQTAHGNFLGCTLIKGGNHMSAHFDPILWIVAQLYRLYQHAEFLLVFQTLWLASGALPLWKLARHRLGNEWMAATLVIVYFLFPALHGVNMFDFHSVALSIPLAMWAVYLLDVGGMRRYWLVFALLLATREDMSLLSCFIGAYALLIGRTRAGLVTIGLSLAYLVCVKAFVMADPNLLMSADKAYSYLHFYEEMIPHRGEGARGLLTTLLINPVYAVQVVFKEGKFLFLLHVLLPLLALPLASGRKVVLTLYGFLFILLSSRKNVWSVHYQYSALLFPLLFVAVPDGVRRVVDSPRLRTLGWGRARVAWVLMVGMLAGGLLVSWKRGVIFHNESFVAGWTRFERTPTQAMLDRYAKVRELVERVGPDAKVSVSHEIGAHFSNRRFVYHWPTIQDAQFIVLFTEIYSFHEDDHRRWKDLVRRGRYRVLEDSHGIILLERVEGTDLPEEFRGDQGERPDEDEAPEAARSANKSSGARAGASKKP